MKRGIAGVSFCTAVLMMGLITRADEGMANPAYDAWAKAKVGAVVKYSQASDAMGNKSAGEMTQTLKEITPEAAKVEMKMSMTIAGNKMDMPATMTTIPAKSTGSKTPVAAPADGGAKPEQAKEDVTVDGKTYSCTVTSVSSDTNGMKSTSKVWSCPDVPGGLVKSESSTTGTVVSSTTMTLLSVETK